LSLLTLPAFNGKSISMAKLSRCCCGLRSLGIQLATSMKIRSRLIAAALCSAGAMSAGLNCDLSEYQPSDGLTATVNGAVLQLVWQGDRGWPLRAFITIRDGQPVVAELAVRKGPGE